MKVKKIVIFMMPILLLTAIFIYFNQMNKIKLENEIKEEINTLNALSLSYSLNDAINDGYYYEVKPAEVAAKDMIRFLSYVHGNIQITLKIVFEQENELTLSNVISNVVYGNRTFFVINYNINYGSNQRNWEQKEYKYLIVLDDTESCVFRYYLTNDKTLYESVQADSTKDYDIEKQDTFYLFARSYAQ